MPATFTHAIFATDVYDNLNNHSRKLLKNNLAQYRMFAQSMDSMMFYNIESLRKGKDLRKFQHTFHTTNTKDFFIEVIKYIKLHRLYNNEEVMSFLYGFICHYVLDSNIHPFVIYKTGIFEKGNKDSYKYNNLHAYMETFLDNYLIHKRMNDIPYNFKIYDYAFDLKIFSNDLCDLIDNVFFKVFNIKDMSGKYFLSLKQMKIFIKRYRYDNFGIKLNLYKLIDFFTPQSIFKFKALSYHYNSKQNEYFLNSEHNIWYNPCCKDLFSYESFDDLYEKSIKDAVKIIESISNLFKGSKVNLDNIFTNNSYLSGLDCNKNFDFKYFYF